MNKLALVSTITFAILFHQSLLRGRVPVEAIGEFDTLAECYAAWDELPAAAQQFSWCSDKGDAGSVGAGQGGGLDPTQPTE